MGVPPARRPQLSLCSRLSRLHPGPSHHTCRNVPASIPWCFRAPLGCRPLPPHAPLPCTAAHTPAGLSRSILWFSLHRFAPPGFPLSESPGELVRASVLFGGSSVPPTLSRMACDAAGPSGHLGHVCEFVAPLPAAAGGLLLSVHCPAVSLSVSPRHPRPMAGGAQRSSGFDQNGGPSC